MSLRRSTPLTFNPRSLSDALDGTNVFAGAMASLQNLVPDPSTRALWQCRPAAISLINFATQGGGFSSGFSSGFQLGFSQLPIGLISCLKVIGNVAYGMVATARNPGNDEPFAYNLLTNTFALISGVTSANTPASPAATGAWTPPTMDLVGTNLLVTHPGYTGAGGVYFGWFDISNPSAITWSGGQLSGAVTFATAPAAVRNFNGRAYWITNPPTGQPAVIFSDVLVPRTVTNANQVITFDDNVPLTALAPLPLNNQLGGIIQALIVFKGVQNMYQITGDAASTSNPLSKNALNVATGTLAPNSIASTPKGLAFIAPDGLRFIDFNGNVGDPTGTDGMGKTLPFIYSVVPSRMCAAANGSIYRVTTQDGSLNGSPWVEYWYDMTRQIWSGPHTFPASGVAPYNNTFIMAPRNVAGALWQADFVQSATSTFTENGSPITFNWTTSMLPDPNDMSEHAMIETTIYMGQASGASYSISALDQNGTILQSAILTNTSVPTIWGAFAWGQAPWGGQQSLLFPRRVPWPAPIVFRRMQLYLTGTSSAAVRVGMAHMKYEKLGYLQQSDAA
jgi:hypothetical protein